MYYLIKALHRRLRFWWLRSRLSFETYEKGEADGFLGWWILPNKEVNPQNVVAFMGRDHKPQFKW